MARKKGMTVDISASAGEYRKELNRIKKETNSFSAEMKRINNQMKFSKDASKNVELIAQKGTVLNKCIGELQSKLSQLKKLQDEMSKNPNLTESQQKDYRNLSREIQFTQDQLKKLRAEQSKNDYNNSKLGMFSNQLKKAGNSLDNIANKTAKMSAVAGGFTGIAVNTAISMEDSFAGVRKTVNATEEQFEKLKKSAIDMSKEMPSSAESIMDVMTLGGQLGIHTENLEKFSKTIIDLSNATNIVGEEGAQDIAKFMNITNMAQGDIDKFSSAIVDLGNHSATTEKDILSMAMRIAASGKSVGMTQPEILGMATALSSVGLESEAGGTAISKLMNKMNVAVSTGNKDLASFAKIAGVSAEEFKRAFGKSAVDGMNLFIDGLKRTEKSGGSAVSQLHEMGINEARLSDTILRLVKSNTNFTESIEMSNKAWNANTALTDEVNKRYSTTKSKIEITKNAIRASSEAIGKNLLPTVKETTEHIAKVTEKISKLDPAILSVVGKGTALLALTYPFMKAGGTILKGTSNLIDLVKKVKTLSLSPQIVGITVGLTALAGIMALVSKRSRENKEAAEEEAKGLEELIKKKEDAYNKSRNYVNEELSRSKDYKSWVEERKNLEQEIVDIKVNAVLQKRKLDEDEVKSIEDKQNRIKELVNQEIEFAKAVTEVKNEESKSELKNFEGDNVQLMQLFEEKKGIVEQSQNDIIEKLKEQKTNELAVLRMKHEEAGTIDTDAYKEEYARVQKSYDDKIAAIQQRGQEEIGAYSEIANAKLQNNIDSNEKLKGLFKEIEDENKRHNDKLIENEKDKNAGVIGTDYAEYVEKNQHKEKLQKIMKQHKGNLDQSTKDQLQAYLMMVVDAEVQGKELTDKQKETAENIISAYEGMPKETQEAMKNAMTPMLTEMEKQSPILYSKASSIAGGILSRLRTAFDIHSPSRKTKAIFKNVMLGMEEGIDQERTNLMKMVDSISEETMYRLNDLAKNNYNLNVANDMIDRTQVIYTTPTMNFYPREMTEEELRKAFNYTNKRLGASY